jgi:hypothetical protein
METMKPQTEKQDEYGERGCCLVCDETSKENIQGVQRDVWLNGKNYDCLCLEGKCVKCSWYFQGECQRKEVMVDEQG